MEFLMVMMVLSSSPWAMVDRLEVRLWEGRTMIAYRLSRPAAQGSTASGTSTLTTADTLVPIMKITKAVAVSVNSKITPILLNRTMAREGGNP